MKRFLSILVVITLVAVLFSFGIAGCSKKVPSSTSSQSQPVIKPKVIKLADVVTKKDSYNIAAEKIKEIVEKKTNGKIQVEIHPNGDLGDERTLIEGLQQGTIDMAITANAPVANFLPETSVLAMPFLFHSPDEAYYILDGPAGQKILTDMESIKIHGLAWAQNGFRDLSNSKRPVKTAANVKGLKIRLMQNPLYVDTFKELGANAVPMAWGDCLTALQEGTIDGQENPVTIFYHFKLWESQKYLTLDRHTYSAAPIMMSLKVWNSLTPQEQNIFTEAAIEGAKASRKFCNDNEAEQLKEIKDHGVQIVANPDIDSFQKAVEPVYKKYGPKFGDLLTQIQNELKKYRANKKGT